MTKITRRTFAATAAAAAAGAGLGLKPSFAQANYPTRPVQVICPWGAGGGTDATARIVSALLEKDLGQPFNVVNRTGGSGVVGHSAIATPAPDGYTIGMITVEIAMMHWQGLTDLTPKSYTPLALLNEDPPGVQVKSDSPYKTLKELADAIKAAPAGKFKASGTGQGGIWHLALVGWLTAMGLKPDHVPWVPSNGAAPAMQDLAAGGIDIVTCSVPEAKAMIDAGKARSLAVMAAQRNPQFKDVPTLKEAIGVDYSVGAWRGIAAPKGLPAPIANKLTAALKKVYDSKEYKDFMSSRGFGVTWGDAAQFASFMEKSETLRGVAIKAAGLAKDLTGVNITLIDPARAIHAPDISSLTCETIRARQRCSLRPCHHRVVACDDRTHAQFSRFHRTEIWAGAFPADFGDHPDRLRFRPDVERHHLEKARRKMDRARALGARSVAPDELHSRSCPAPALHSRFRNGRVHSNRFPVPADAFRMAGCPAGQRYRHCRGRHAWHPLVLLDHAARAAASRLAQHDPVRRRWTLFSLQPH